jgi:hypothetical protein
MAAALFALLVMAQAVPDGPVRTQPSTSMTNSAPVSTAQPLMSRPRVQAPEDDYGYVAWCYGALETYVNLYDQVMPEVTRIESAFPSPRGVTEDLKVYPQMRDQARKDLEVYRAAIVAAEKASPQAIAPYGATSMRRGRALWTGADQAAPGQLAREWMGWAPPRKCDETARALTVKSNVLGQALIYNQPSAIDAAAEPPAATPVVNTPTPPVPRPVTPQPAPPMPAPAPVPPAPAPRPVTASAAAPTQVAEAPAAASAALGLRPAIPAAAPAAPAPATTSLPPGAFMMDPDGDVGCPGRLDASIRGGQIVMICIP